MKTAFKIDDAIIIICSTPYSKRIPKKCFKWINGKPALEHIFDRIKPTKFTVILAVPDNTDELTRARYHSCIIDKNVSMHYSNSQSPLHRMADAIRWQKPKYIIRITHDDIIIDSRTIEDMLEYTRTNNLSYCCSPSIIEGAGVEIILTETILKQAEKITYPVEHVSYFVKGDNAGSWKPRKSIQRPYRLTLDYPEDAIVLEAVLRQVGNDATVDKICEYLDDHQGLLRYNALPEVTVYTCMRNAEKWIKECVASVCIAEKMSKTSVEYIIIDDTSSDDSLCKAITQLGLWGFVNTKIMVNESNIGLASSSNIALSIAKGKYILRVDADDILKMGAIREMVEKIKKDDSIIVYPDYEEMNGDVGAFIIKTYKDIKGNINHHAGCALMNKKVLNELKFKEGLRHWDSIELYKRIVQHHEFKISYLEEVMFTYRKHKDSLSGSEPDKRKKLLKELYGDGKFKQAN